MKEKILKELNAIFRDVFDDENLVITRGTSSKDIEDWDSIEQINLIIAIEDYYDLKFTVKEVNKLKDVGEMVDYIIRGLNI